MTWFGNPVTIILELLLPYNVAIRKDNSEAHISAWRNGYEPMFQWKTEHKIISVIIITTKKMCAYRQNIEKNW